MIEVLAVVYLVLTLACLAAMVRSPEREVRGLLPVAWQLSGVALTITVLVG